MSDSATAFASGVSAVAEALRTLAVDPADQIRLLSDLATYRPAPPQSSAPIGQAIATVTVSTAALCRQAALVSLARACADYQPSSSNDAQSVLASVTALFDAEILIAADAGDQQSYEALRALRVSVVQDLNARAAALPQIVTVTVGASLPSLVLAYRLYRDATRSDDLIARANPIHPAFFPSSFEALSS